METLAINFHFSREVSCVKLDFSVETGRKLELMYNYCRFLEHASGYPSSSPLTLTCDVTSSTLVGWSLSPDGSPNNVVFDTSPTKYMVNGNTLAVSSTDVNGTDEGLYRCVYEGGITADERCVYVYGKFINI